MSSTWLSTRSFFSCSSYEEGTSHCRFTLSIQHLSRSFITTYYRGPMRHASFITALRWTRGLCSYLRYVEAYMLLLQLWDSSSTTELIKTKVLRLLDPESMDQVQNKWNSFVLQLVISRERAWQKNTSSSHVVSISLYSTVYSAIYCC
jgi:hypothetical protein